MKFRTVVLLVIGGLFGWMSYGGPVPGMKMQPMKPDARIPSFQERMADNAALENAQRAGRLNESPKQHEMRAVVLAAASDVKSSPCDESRRARLRQALNDFIAYQRQIEDNNPPLEAYQFDGRTIDARSFLNQEVSQVWREASGAGVMRVAAMKPDDKQRAADFGNQYICP